MNDREWLAGRRPPIELAHTGVCGHPLCEIAAVRGQIEASLPREITERWDRGVSRGEYGRIA